MNYGFGYVGHGYQGGYWRDNQFNYNRAVNNIRDEHITTVYNRTIVNNTTVNKTTIINRVSYNGGSQGVQARPLPAEVADTGFRTPRRCEPRCNWPRRRRRIGLSLPQSTEDAQLKWRQPDRFRPIRAFVPLR